eukprot:3764162-Pleurochrysis_carterae.AAC.1
MSPPPCANRALIAALRFGRCKYRTRLVVALTLLRGMLVAFGLALRAIFVPVRAFAPSAGRPLVAPLFIRLRAWTLRVCGLSVVILAADGKGMQ